MADYYIGLISGTSVDAIDAALLDLDSAVPQLVHALNYPLPPDLRTELLALSSPGDNEIQRLGRADNWLGETLAEAAMAVLKASGIKAAEVSAIGSHGQTVRHLPRGEHGFSLQIGDPNRIAERCGITTVADFRRRDLAAGGEGAPLVPAFHAAVFANENTPRVLLNLGGMANITVLPPKGSSEDPVSGFDTGPANVLMDAWIHHHRQQDIDRDGAWASSGDVIEPLLKQMLSDEYFQLPAPKSTGREYFNLAWLDQQLQDYVQPIAPEDVQATLCELTAASVADAIERLVSPAPDPSWELVACGGGVHNRWLMERLASHLAPMTLLSTAKLGIAPDWVEACAFAWLARETLRQRPGNVPTVTGARRAVILGGIYPA